MIINLADLTSLIKNQLNCLFDNIKTISYIKFAQFNHIPLRVFIMHQLDNYFIINSSYQNSQSESKNQIHQLFQHWMTSIIVFQIILQVCACQLIVDNQVEELSLYKIQHDDSQFTIWFRFQPQFFSDGENPTPFLSINTWDLKLSILFNYEQKERLQVSISIPKLDYQQNLISLKSFDKQTWICINLLKEEQFSSIKAENITIQLPKIQESKQQYYGTLNTWQNLTFSLKGYKGVEQSNNIDYFHLKNNPILKLYKQLVMNYKYQIQLEMHIRKRYEDKQIIMQIKDQEYNYYMFYGDNTIQIVINSEYERTEKQFYNIQHNQWFRLKIQFESNRTISVIDTINEQFEWIYENKVLQQFEGVLPQYFGLIIEFFNRQTEIDNIIIINNKSQQVEHVCYPGCKICKELQCLECQNNLFLSDQCSCEDNQYYDFQIGICKDITQYPGLQQNTKQIQICSFYQYYNSRRQQCMECPHIEQYYCTDCIYNTKLWQTHKTCTFQEMQSDIFLHYQSVNYDLDPNTYVLVFNEDYSQITNQKCDIYQEQGVIQCKFHYFDYLMKQICDIRYYNIMIHKCMTQRGIFHQHLNRIMCKQNYTLITNKCVKCQLNCVICVYNLKQFSCLITNDGFYVQTLNKIIKKCNQDQEECDSTIQSSQINHIKEEYQKGCKLQINNTCLLCIDNFILNIQLKCIEGQVISNLFNFQFSSYNFKQFNYNQLKQLKISLDTPRNGIIRQQIMFYGRQYENIKFSSNQIKNNNLNCLKKINFNQTEKCIVFETNFTSVFDNQQVFYCPNDQCSYKMTLNIIILLSNRQLVKYENSTYYNIQDLLDNLNIQLYISEITFIAEAHVFDSYEQKCYDHQTFYLDRTKIQQTFPNTYFKLVVLFQAGSKFPECWGSNFYSNFEQIEIRNLLIENQLQVIEFHSEVVKFIDCKIQNSDDIQIVIDASIILFQNVEFKNSNHNNSLIYLMNQVRINQIEFLNCKFVNISIYENTILINIIQYTENIRINDLTLFHSVIDDSSFIQFHSFNQLTIEQIFIAQIDTILANFFTSLQVTNNSTIKLIHITILDSEFWHSSFYQIHGYTDIEDVRITRCLIQKSQIFSINNKVSFKDVQFAKIQLDRSFLINCQGLHYNMRFKQINIIDSYFNQTTSAISIIAKGIKFEQITLQNCHYYPPLNFIDVQATTGIINQINLTNIMIEKQFQQQIVVLPNYLMNFEFQNLKIRDINFQNFIIVQVKLMHISYLSVMISNFVISNFQLLGGQLNELIMFSERNKASNLILFSLNIDSVYVNWLYLSKLLSLQGNFGTFKISNIVIRNVNSISQHQIIFSSRNNLFLFNIDAEFQQFTGLLKQHQSKVLVKKYKQNQNMQVIQQWNTPLFSNLDPRSEYESITIINSTFINQRQPILQFRHNKLVQLKIKNLKIYNSSSFQDLFTLDLENYINLDKMIIVFSIFIDKVYILNYYNKASKFIQCEFSQISLSNIALLNTNLIIMLGRFNGLTRIRNVFIQNSNLSDLNFFMIRNINSHFYAENIYLSYQQGNASIFLFDTFNFPITKYYFIIIKNVLIKNCRNCKTLIQINQIRNLINFFIVEHLNIMDSNFLGYMIQITRQNQLLTQIQHVIIQNTEMQVFVFIQENQNYKLQHVSLINVIIRNEMKWKQQFIKSYIFNSTMNGFQLVLVNSQLMIQKDEKLIQEPIAISFSEQGTFKSKLINENCYQTYYSNNQSIAYVPTGIQLSEYIYIDPITKLQEKPYSNFIIILNLQPDDQIDCYLKQSIDGQVGNYSNINQFELQNGINIIQNFTFLMNPYLNYSYIQNDIICNDLTIRFNTKALPCQLGEYLYQNRCLICDIKRNYYSVTKKAQLCNIINEDQIEQLNYGNIKLKPGFWRAKSDSNKVEQCINQQCGGGWVPGDHSCNIGYVGALCKECDIYNIKGNGKFASYNDTCNLCEFDYTIVLKGVFVLMWLMMLAYLSYDTNRSLTQQYLFYKITQRNVAEILMRQSINQISVIIKIMTNYCFYLYLFRDKLDFLYQQVNISLDLISNPQLIIKPQVDCILGDFSYLSIPILQLIVALISPFYTLSILYLFYMILLTFKMMKFRFSFIIITIFSVYIFNQQLIFQIQIQSLSWKTISNVKWVQLNQQLQFDTKQHFKSIQYFITPSNILITLLPAVLFIVLRLQDKKSVKTIKYFGILFREYKIQKYYWEICRIYQRYIMILLLYYCQNEFTILYIQVIYGLFMYAKPYPLKNLNYLESQALYFLTSIFIDIFYMKDHSIYIRGVLFFLFNLILFKNVISGIIKSSNLQYRTQFMNLKQIISKFIPVSQRYLQNNKSISLQRSMEKMKQSYLNQKLSIQSKTIYSQGEIILTTNRNPLQSQTSEVEMLNFLHK